MDCIMVHCAVKLKNVQAVTVAVEELLHWSLALVIGSLLTIIAQRSRIDYTYQFDITRMCYVNNFVLMMIVVDQFHFSIKLILELLSF